MFAEKLKKLREEKNLSQSEFARILGVERTRYGKWENRGFEPPFESLIKIADFFDVSIDYLLGRTDEPERKKMPAELADIGVKEVVTVDGQPLTQAEIDAIRRMLLERNG